MLIPVQSSTPLRPAVWIGLVVSILLAAPLSLASQFTVGPQAESVDLESYASVYYVSAETGSDQDGDGTREAPWASIARAFEVLGSPSAEYPLAVFVAGGTYSGKTLKMQSYLDLYGGFSAETWERDIFTHETILDGEHLRRVITGANQARIDGFVLIRGRADGHGGAILCDSSSPTITNNRFEFSFTQAPVGFRHDRLFQDGHGGGAIACLYDAVPVIANNSFVGNWTEIGTGGALLFLGKVRLTGSPKADVRQNLFYRNTAGQEDRHATRSSSGGAIACSREANPVIRGNLLIDNQALGGSDGGAIFNASFSSPLIQDNAIVGNRCDDDGAGFYTMGLGNPILEDNIVAGNVSSGKGIGGIASGVDGRIALIGNAVVENRTGGGIFLMNSFAIVDQNIVAGNQGGPGLRFSQQSSVFTASVLSRNAFFDNEKGPFFLDVSEGELPQLEGNHLKGSAVIKAIRTNSDSALSIQVENLRFDPKRCRTTMDIPEGVFEPDGLTGRLFTLADRWTVVASNTADSLTVMGEMKSTGSDDSTAGPYTSTIPPLYPALEGLEILLPPVPLLEDPSHSEPSPEVPD